MPAPAIAETRADHDARASLFTALTAPWRHALDLARHLGVSPAALSMWCSGDRVPSWGAIRAAGRATALRHRGAVPTLVKALAREVLDVEGTWIPDADLAVATEAEEADDVSIVLGRYLTARRAGDLEAARRYAEQLVTEAVELAAAARSQ